VCGRWKSSRWGRFIASALFPLVYVTPCSLLSTDTEAKRRGKIALGYGLTHELILKLVLFLNVRDKIGDLVSFTLINLK